ncbi:response regulator receiver domain protein [Striga asiatica]|uniref:Response regulator receiver domain protein n=1 Tax=Striga asiatica TaxID=4170 RepID=A0A5A7R6F6_STRAF|nr:response regulator receiver domain protein [Striga asiatica]
MGLIYLTLRSSNVELYETLFRVHTNGFFSGKVVCSRIDWLLGTEPLHPRQPRLNRLQSLDEQLVLSRRLVPSRLQAFVVSRVAAVSRRTDCLLKVGQFVHATYG